MAIIMPTIIAPDSSHWAKWIDSTTNERAETRQHAQALYGKLLERGRIPLVTMHHIEELLGVDDVNSAHRRMSFIREMPLLAYPCLSSSNQCAGTVATVLAAELIAACEGCNDLFAVRARARELLLRTGAGIQAVGESSQVVDFIRAEKNETDSTNKELSVFGRMDLFDEKRTIGDLSKLSIAGLSERIENLKALQERLVKEAIASIGDAEVARGMAERFAAEVLKIIPRSFSSVRSFLEWTLMEQGLDADEIRDDCVLADLTRLALFRSQVRVVAPTTGKSLIDLSRVPMDILPSRIILDALAKHGQRRTRRPGSDVNDGYLGAFAAYSSILYVDKRTAEDFSRARRMEPRLNGLVGEISKKTRFEDLLGDP